MKQKIPVVLVSPNSFKECLSSDQVANHIMRGLKQGWRNLNIIKLPVADGGNGTLDVFIKGINGVTKTFKVSGPLGDIVKARMGFSSDNKLAIIEMAEASGLHLVPIHFRNPLLSSTYGTGELILKALDQKVKKIIVGVGGSATVDGGVGMAQALGVRFLEKSGMPVGWGARDLIRIHNIDMSGLDKRVKSTRFIVACDVQSPLFGKRGAVNMFARQKGATSIMLPKLEAGMKHLAKQIYKQIGVKVSNIPGAGAAGGLGAGLVAFCGAKIQNGGDIVLDSLGFDDYLQKADWIITGEGRLDAQTIQGKAPIAVAKQAKIHGVPVIAIAGSISNDAGILYKYGIAQMYSIQTDSMSLEQSIRNAGKLIERTSEDIARFIKTIT